MNIFLNALLGVKNTRHYCECKEKLLRKFKHKELDKIEKQLRNKTQ